jgi:hypothetical protein
MMKIVGDRKEAAAAVVVVVDGRSLRLADVVAVAR